MDVMCRPVGRLVAHDGRKLRADGQQRGFAQSFTVT